MDAKNRNQMRDITSIFAICILVVSSFACAASKSEAEKKYNIGTAYWFGRGVEQDRSQACKLFYESAELGYGHAMFNYANCIRQGVGEDKNIDEAIRYLKAANDNGIREAKLAIASLYLYEIDDETLFPEAFKYLNEYLSDFPNDRVANFNIANMYFSGYGTDKNVVKALYHYEVSAKYGNELSLALMYLVSKDGLYGTKQNEEKSEFWKDMYKSIVQDDSRPISMAIAKLYEEGWGVEKSITKSEEWNTKKNSP